ncbi:RNA polymerase sigma factor [Paenibacillus sp. MMS18-CY102]|uniref:RNA polymerase sigma factor n=1 Tax=Paenibacillus sp. MMS18-CY102 TaxID=2682849 RepID=UPI0013662F72|nr:sigma-70 family RNA polymerase sigma factor [Paenibacillus sp. MMS18-CY102]MWC27198.1 sigma-70 family RNA polymerase sigma factor [Paenibacillus sp. MMS18-CY102]
MFSLLVERHRQSMYAAAYAVLRDAEQAEDAVQEAFLRVYLSLPSCRLDGLRTWMARIAVNTAIDAQRRERRRLEVAQQAANEDQVHIAGEVRNSPEETLLRKERNSQLQGLLEALPVGQMRVVKAFYIDECSQRDIAVQEKVEIKSIESRLYRARQWLRSQWEKGDGT